MRRLLLLWGMLLLWVAPWPQLVCQFLLFIPCG
jgi:hypothetical protein